MSQDWAYVHRENVGPGRVLSLRLNGPWIFEDEELFPELGGMKQRVQIGDFTEFGRGLVIDGQVQLAESADALYTTALVFPPALLAKSRKKWLVIGGGDGPTVREALRFRDTESVLLVDISRMVIEQTQLLIPSFWLGAIHDPRLTIECRDAWQVLRERLKQGESFDVIVFDLTDWGDQGISTPNYTADHLYSEAAFGLAAQLLHRNGIFVAQVQELSPIRWQLHSELRRRVQTTFLRLWSYRVFVEYFGYWESFVMATNDAALETPFPAESGEKLLARLYSGDTSDVWSDAWHRHLFTLSPMIERELGIHK